MATVDLPHGTIHYRQSGSGAPIVFLHGYLMGANLWDPVVQLLDGEFGCITPDLPFGAHPTPIAPAADLTTAGLGRLVADFLQALDLYQVILSATTPAARSPRWWPRATLNGWVGWCWPPATPSTTILPGCFAR